MCPRRETRDAEDGEVVIPTAARRRGMSTMPAAAVSLALSAVVAALTPGQVSGLIPPRYDMAQTRWWEQTAVRPAAPQHQTTSYRVYNSAGPLPPYSFSVNSVGPKPACRSRSNCGGYQPSPVFSGASGTSPKPPAGYEDSANSAGPKPPPGFQINSVGPKPTPGYHPTVNTAGPKPPRDFQTVYNSAVPKMPPFVTNSVGPKLPPGYSYPASGVGPKPPVATEPEPVGSQPATSGVGPKPPRGYTFSAGPKLSRNLVLPVTSAPAPDSAAPAPPQGRASGSAQAHASAQVRGRGQDGAQVRTHAHSQAGHRKPDAHSQAGHRKPDAHSQTGHRKPRPWGHFEKEVKAGGHRSGAPSVSGPPCDDSCPRYQTVSRTTRYEVRLYPATIWASYVTATENRLLAEMEALAGIADFLEGDNSQGVRLTRGFPTLTQLQFSTGHGAGRQSGGDFSVSVPLLEETDPPRPSTDQVVLDSVDQQRVFVMAFWARPWKLTDRSLRMRTRRFSRRLRRHGQTFLDEYFYLAKYKESSSERRSYYEIWLYGTPHESTHRFRPMGKRLLDRRSNLTIATMRRLCRGRECPRFEVLAELPGGIQKRHYYNAAFATSRLERCQSSLSALWRSLMPLHLYREGVNSHLERIEPTRPAGVLRVWQEGGDGALSTANGTAGTCHMTVMVYLPRRLHRSPPNTGNNAPTIGLSYIHELTVYVQTAGDLDLGSGRLEEHVTDFHQRLDRLGLCYKSDEYFVAVYDDVQRYHGRLNEMWTVAQRCPQQEEEK